MYSFWELCSVGDLIKWSFYHGRRNRGGTGARAPPVLQKLILPEMDIL